MDSIIWNTTAVATGINHRNPLVFPAVLDWGSAEMLWKKNSTYFWCLNWKVSWRNSQFYSSVEFWSMLWTLLLGTLKWEPTLNIDCWTLNIVVEGYWSESQKKNSTSWCYINPDGPTALDIFVICQAQDFWMGAAVQWSSVRLQTGGT